MLSETSNLSFLSLFLVMGPLGILLLDHNRRRRNNGAGASPHRRWKNLRPRSLSDEGDCSEASEESSTFFQSFEASRSTAG